MGFVRAQVQGLGIRIVGSGPTVKGVDGVALDL